MLSCIAKAALAAGSAAVISSAATVGGMTLAGAGSPAASPAGQYLTDLAAANLPIAANAVNAAATICVQLPAQTQEQLARGYLLGHANFTLPMAEQLISITVPGTSPKRK